MPELPEVETVRAGLEKILENKPIIEKVRLHRGDIRFPIPRELATRLKGQPILGVRRRAKYLLIETPAVTLLNHLGMTGSWRVERTSTRAVSKPLDPHDHCEVDLNDGRSLVFRDPRRFGLLDLVEKGGESSHPRLKGLGVEPLDEQAFNGEFLYSSSRRRKIAIKVFLMDQKVVVGVGNIYASEALFRAGIKPTRAAGKITRREADALAQAVRQVLYDAIRAGGSSIRDFRQAGGSQGYFQTSFQVYDRAGQSCRTCGAKIQSRVIGGRSTYWCRHCQK
jgi:formamidopyrimidine-DNA glycosylase